MALNDINSLVLVVDSAHAPVVMHNLGRHLSDYLWSPVTDDPASFFYVFSEGSKQWDLHAFFVQTRMNRGGRIGLSYGHVPVMNELRVSVYDNGEDISETLVKEVIGKILAYAVQKDLSVVRKPVIKEC
ncbi:MAG: hypothetical protein Q7R96_05400 [Nanoarchaeota archaeon]|nr:hypothetical protein [Nanoarchaeota archaeon]